MLSAELPPKVSNSTRNFTTLPKMVRVGTSIGISFTRTLSIKYMMLWLRQSQTALFQIFQANTSNLNTQKLDVARVEFCLPRRKAEQKADVGLKSTLSMSIPSPQRLIIALPLWSYRCTVRTNALMAASYPSNLAFSLLTERATPWLRYTSPILVLAVLVAGWRDD